MSKVFFQNHGIYELLCREVDPLTYTDMFFHYAVLNYYRWGKILLQCVSGCALTRLV